MSKDGIVRKYLIEEKKLNPIQAENFLNMYKKYEDILDEFIASASAGKIVEDGVKSGEWTAKMLSEKFPHLELHIVYEFMVGLRDQKDLYEQFIAEGAPIL